jgi:hypothetical protein
VALPVLPDLLDLQIRVWVPKVLKALKDRQELQAAAEAPLVLQDLKAIQPTDHRVQMDLMETREHKDQVVHRDLKEIQAMTAKLL